MPSFELIFPETEINYWSERYDFGSNGPPEKAISFAKSNRFLDKNSLYEICDWKSSRQAGKAKENSEETTKELTKFSFSTSDEFSRVSSLTLLKGVMWPTASVILHFCVSERYPILDVRAIWSLGERKPSYYSFEYWSEYVAKCQEIADRNSISVRCLDKALWQYSKEHQDTIS